MSIFFFFSKLKNKMNHIPYQVLVPYLIFLFFTQIRPKKQCFVFLSFSLVLFFSLKQFVIPVQYRSIIQVSKTCLNILSVFYFFKSYFFLNFNDLFVFWHGRVGRKNKKYSNSSVTRMILSDQSGSK